MGLGNLKCKQCNEVAHLEHAPEVVSCSKILGKHLWQQKGGTGLMLLQAISGGENNPC